MKTEEAIEIVCIGREKLLTVEECHKVVDCLKRGEKYKKIVEILELDMEGQYCITPMDIYFKKDTIGQQIKNIKRKYFSKEVK